MADINSSLPVTDTTDGTLGAAAPSVAQQIAGRDASNNLQTLKIDAQGGVLVAGEGTAGTPVGGVLSIQGVSSGTKVGVNLNDGSGNSLSSNLYNSSYALQTRAQDGPGLDNLLRLRTSEQNTVFSCSFANSPQTLLVTNAVTGSSTVASNTSTSSLRLTNTTSSSDSAIVQTRSYVVYSPGRSYETMISGNIGAKKANVTQRWGYYDANDGLFWQQTVTNLSIVIRTSASGSPVDTVVNQSSWNLDKLDGTGASGVTLDTSKHNLYIVDFLWLGAGRVRWGVIVGGVPVYCHQTTTGNINATPITRTPALPMRVELLNTGTAASSTTLDVVCFSVARESIDDPSNNILFSQSRGTTTLATTGTEKPLISITPKTTFNGITNRTPVVPQNINILGGSQNTLVRVYFNGTLTGASFTSADPSSTVNYDVTATAISGGSIIAEYYVASGGTILAGITSSTVGVQLGQLALGLNVAGTSGDIITVTATSLAGGTNTFGAISWLEYQ